MPSHARLDLFEVDVPAPDNDFAERALIAVLLVILDSNLFAKDEVGEVLLRARAERLAALRRVNAGESDAVLGVVRVEHRQSIAVSD